MAPLGGWVWGPDHSASRGAAPRQDPPSAQALLPSPGSGRHAGWVRHPQSAAWVAAGCFDPRSVEQTRGGRRRGESSGPAPRTVHSRDTCSRAQEGCLASCGLSRRSGAQRASCPRRTLASNFWSIVRTSGPGVCLSCVSRGGFDGDSFSFSLPPDPMSSRSRSFSSSHVGSLSHSTGCVIRS